MNRMLFILTVTTLLYGCVSMNVKKVSDLKGNEEICIVDAPSVRQAFRDAYERRIIENGYQTRIITDKNDPSCELTTTYFATYGVHWGLFLATAKLKVFRGAKLVGEASYHAPWASPAKHGRVEPKIGSMVNELLPKR